MSELYHHGIKGQKWGVRRFQNEDGSLTAAGRQRYGSAKESDDAIRKRIKEGKGSWDETQDVRNTKGYQRWLSTDKRIREANQERVQKLNDASKEWLDTGKELRKQKDKLFQTKKTKEITKLLQDKYDKLGEYVKNESNSFMKAIENELEKSMKQSLKELGYHNTDLGRRFIRDAFGQYYD